MCEVLSSQRATNEMLKQSGGSWHSFVCLFSQKIFEYTYYVAAAGSDTGDVRESPCPSGQSSGFISMSGSRSGQGSMS